MFWKLFLALWLSIMTFAAVVSWINQTVILSNAIEEPAEVFQSRFERFKQKLTRDLSKGDTLEVRRTLKALPRGLRHHIFVLDEQGRELSGRDRLLKMNKQARVRTNRHRVHDANGKQYTLVTINRRPPRPLMAPGPEGVGLRLGVAAIVSALVSLLLARYLAAPLGQLSRVSRELATGDLAARVGAPLEKRQDEFGQLARDMDEMASRLQASQQANRRLLRDVSHELRSPLARLRVALEIARNKDQSQVAAELNRIELESERLEQLVDEVLSLLRETSGFYELKLERFELGELLQDLVNVVNYEINEAGSRVDLQATAGLFIEADRELLWRTFENLLRNAIVHSGGQPVIGISAQRSGDEIRVTVSDSGPGIPEPHISRIFEPFYRVDEARNRRSGGHGLGLAIAASAVRRHGGAISAANRSRGGLAVTVRLPVNPLSA